MSLCTLLVAVSLSSQLPPDAKTAGKAAPTLKKGETVASASLEMKPDVLTSEVHRKNALMSYPLMVRLSTRKPANITREPKYTGSPRYGTVRAGNGPSSAFDLVFDESDAAAKLYLDADRDGDLTNDPPVAWDAVTAENDKTSLETLLRLPASWSEESFKPSGGIYGVTLRKTKGVGIAFLTRSGARTGTIQVGDKTYAIALAENTADAVFDNYHASKSKKPGVWLLVDLNGDKTYETTEDGREVLDTSKPFPIGESWFTAEFPEDGSSIELKRAAPPAIVERPRSKLLGVGKSVPDFALVDAEGKLGKFSETHGKIRIVDFWATWCGPCIASMPRVEALYQKVKGQGVEVIGLNVMDDEAKFKDWVKEKSGTFHYRFVRDDDGKNHEASGAVTKLGVDAIPTIFLIDEQDKVVLVVQGFGDENEAKLKASLKKLGIATD
jgi:thiol-disulfide isomerase/thioredoxin